MYEQRNTYVLDIIICLEYPTHKSFSFISVSYRFSRQNTKLHSSDCFCELGTIQVLRHHVLTFLGPPTHLSDDLQQKLHCESSKIAIF